MSAPRLELDFAGRRAHGGPLGIAVATLGALCLIAVLLQQHALQGQRQGLELRLDALLGAAHRVQSVSSVAGLSAQTAEKTVRELGTPWSQLLVELEDASGDTAGNVAVLAIEPDHTKHRVRVTAEARTLELALAYVQRLRRTDVLHYPMLDSHEVRADDKDHPVRFQISADWSDAT
ncbi:MAG: hypothetical protein KGJ52_03990 [Gammaproteobacteria bacterium]|nr:hypothetical protein [Gammaproteobacteria bacterium]